MAKESEVKIKVTADTDEAKVKFDALAASVKAAQDATRPGYRTTEFWLAALAWIVATFLSAGIFPDTHVAVKVASFVAAALAALGYTAARSNVKSLGEKK